jgi:hypothetical protein
LATHEPAVAVAVAVAAVAAAVVVAVVVCKSRNGCFLRWPSYLRGNLTPGVNVMKLFLSVIYEFS